MWPGRVVAPPGEGAYLGEPPAAVAVIVTWRGAASLSLDRHLVSVSGDVFPGPPDVVGSRRVATWPRTTYLGEATTASAAIATTEETRRGSSCFTWNASLVGPLRAAPASAFRMKPSPTAQPAMFHVKPLASRTWSRPPRETPRAESRGAPGRRPGHHVKPLQHRADDRSSDMTPAATTKASAATGKARGIQSAPSSLALPPGTLWRNSRPVVACSMSTN